MNWNSYVQGFSSYLKLEKSLSPNSIEAYTSDVQKLIQFLQFSEYTISPMEVEIKQLREFIQWIAEMGISAVSQARIISGIRAFYKYLLLENIAVKDPTALLELPRLGRKLPDTLSIEEINRLIAAIDLSTPEGERNKAI